MAEEWRSVEGYEGRLEVSSYGSVRTLPSVRTGMRNGVPVDQIKRGTTLSPFMLSIGYLCVAPKYGAERKKLLVHRLVAKAFVPGYFDGATVNHVDGVKTNNAPRNLEWVTLARNTELQWETGLVNLRGERHPSAKLSDSDVRLILRMPDASPTELARRFGVSTSLIYKIRQGRKKAWLIV